MILYVGWNGLGVPPDFSRLLYKLTLEKPGIFPGIPEISSIPWNKSGIPGNPS